MGKNRKAEIIFYWAPLRRFLSILILLPFLNACASASVESESSVQEHALPSGREIEAKLNVQDTYDASVLVLQLKVGSAWVKEQDLKGQIEATFEGRTYKFYEVIQNGIKQDGVFETLVGVPYLYKPGPAVVTVKVGRLEAQKSVDLKFNVNEYVYKSELLTVDPKKINPPPSAMKRIQAEIKVVGAVYSR